MGRYRPLPDTGRAWDQAEYYRCCARETREVLARVSEIYECLADQLEKQTQTAPQDDLIAKPIRELIVEARWHAVETRKNALEHCDVEPRRKWLEIAARWDEVAEGFEQIRSQNVN